MNFERIELAVAERVARITLNRPEKRNALDDLMIRELTSAFRSAGEDPGIKLVMLSGRGPAFCAGADLAYLQRLSEYDSAQNLADSTLLAQLFETIYYLQKPVIAVVDGPALAGGCGLATVCDFVLASEEKAQFGYTEVRIGFIPAIVLTFLIRRVGEGRARQLVIQGNIINARDAESIGLITRAVPESVLGSTAEQLCQELLSQNSLTAMGLCKALIGAISNQEPGSALPLAARANAEARMTAECRKGIKAFLEKKKIEW